MLEPCALSSACLEFRFRVGVQTLALHVLSLCGSVRSRVCVAARSSVHVCFVVLHAVCVFIGCVHSCYILCCVARSWCISLAGCFHVVMSCVNMCLMSFLIRFPHTHTHTHTHTMHLYIYIYIYSFTFCHFADAFIQSDLQLEIHKGIHLE